MVWHGKVWCGADQAKKPAPHLKTGSPMAGSASMSLHTEKGLLCSEQVDKTPLKMDSIVFGRPGP